MVQRSVVVILRVVLVLFLIYAVLVDGESSVILLATFISQDFVSAIRNMYTIVGLVSINQ